MEDTNPTTQTTTQYGVEELRNHVYKLGRNSGGELFVKTTEAIVEYIGRNYPPNMVTLVTEGIEAPPEAPTPPKPTKKSKAKKDDDEPVSDIPSLERETYFQDRSHWLKKMDEYNNNKSKVFHLIKSQCHPGLKTHLESSTEWKDIVKKSDVIRLMALVKEASYSSSATQYDYWILATSLWKLTHCFQMLKEKDLSSFYKRWMGQVEVLEAQWGKFIPQKLATKNKDSDEAARDKLLACLFLLSVHRKRYGQVLDELNNNYLQAQTPYPATPQHMLQLLANMTSHTSQESNRRTPRQDRNRQQDADEQPSTLGHHQRRPSNSGHHQRRPSNSSDDENISIPDTEAMRDLFAHFRPR